jgi:hypothetical protein
VALKIANAWNIRHELRAMDNARPARYTGDAAGFTE